MQRRRPSLPFLQQLTDDVIDWVGVNFFNPLSEAHERLGRRCALFCIDTGFIWMHMFAFVFFLVYIDFVC